MGINRKTNDIFEANYDFAKAKTAYVFKTMVDPFIGKYSFVKVCSGVLKGEDTLFDTENDTEQKLGKLYTMQGNKPVEVSELHAGDIGAIAKLSGVNDRRYTFYKEYAGSVRKDRIFHTLYIYENML